MKKSNLWIKRMLENNNLTHAQLAKTIGISRRTLFRWLNTNLSDLQAMRIDKSLSDLLKKNDKENIADFTIDDIINTDPKIKKDKTEAIKELLKLGMMNSLYSASEDIENAKNTFDNYVNPLFLSYNGYSLQDLLDNIDNVTED